jgi:hypothetical protein
MVPSEKPMANSCLREAVADHDGVDGFGQHRHPGVLRQRKQFREDQ